MSATTVTTLSKAETNTGVDGVYSALAKVGGAILLVAGFIKLVTGVVPEASGVTSLLMPDWALAVTPVYEIALGGWLLVDRCRFGAWLTTIITLAIFSLHNFALMNLGRSSCGCLGAASPTPGIMLGLDVAALLLLLKRRRGWHGWPIFTPGLRQVAITAAVMAVVLGGVVGLSYWRYGSLTAAIAALREEPLAVVPTELELGTVPSGTVVETSVRIYNLTDESASLAYGKGSCSCAVFPDLPLVVPPHGSIDVRVQVTVTGPEGRFQRKGNFRTNVGHVRFGIRGWIAEAKSVTRPNP